VTIQKKSLISSLQTTKKAIVASTPTEAPISAKILPRTGARFAARVTMRVKSRLSTTR
jgi:hypothetical protein